VRRKPMGRLPMFLHPSALASHPGGSTGQSWLVGYAAPRLGESAGVQGRPSFTPPLHLPVVVLQIGHGWMSVKSFTHAAPPHSTELGAGVRQRRPSLLHRKGSRSPVRKMVEVRGAFRTLVPQVRFPSEQKPPGQSVMTVHGMSALVPPTHVLERTVPPASLTLPQMPVPVPVVNMIFVGVPPVQLQAAAASNWQRPLQVCPAGATPHGGSHGSSFSTTPLPHTAPATCPTTMAPRCGSHLRTTLSASVLFDLPFPLEIPFSMTVALPACSFFLPLTGTMTDIESPHAGAPVRSEGAGSFRRLIFPKAVFSAVPAQPGTFV